MDRANKLIPQHHADSTAGTATVTPNATSTDLNTNLTVTYLEQTLYSVPINIKASSTPSDAYTDWTSLMNAIEDYEDTSIGKEFTIQGELEATEYIDVSGKIKLVAGPGGATIYRGSGFKSNFFSVSGNTTFTLEGNGNSLTLDGNTKSGSTISATGSFISAKNGALVEINNNVTLKNNRCDKAGAAIRLEGASLSMYGGEISGNTYTKSSNSDGGGAIYITTSTGYTNVSINMTGGTISGNEATSASGGGIYTATSGSLTIEDESSVKDNTASDETRGPNIYTKP